LPVRHHFLAARIGDELPVGVTSYQRRFHMTGPELKRLRASLGSAIGRQLSTADMARLCGLPAESGDTIRRWEVSGPSGPACELLRILAMASEEYPILDNFNVFDRFDVRERDRPARRAEFREMMRNEVRRRLA
jgi:DNA-binding transcriptional regulator YiaG